MDRASRSVDDGPDPLERCRERLADAEAAFRARAFRSSADAAVEAGELARLVGRPDLLAAAALVVLGVPDPAAAPAVEQICRAALIAVDDGETSVRARLHSQLAIALHHRGRPDEAEVEVDRALVLALEAEDPAALAAALNARQLTMAGLGHGHELLALGEQMLDAARTLGSTEVELQARNWKIDAHFRLGNTDAAGHEIDSLDVLSARSGDVLVRWNARLARAGLAHAVGRLTDAERLAREARDILPLEQRPQTEPLFIAQLILISIDRGIEPPEMGAARDLAIGAHPIAAAMTGRYDLEMGHMTRAQAAFEAVRPRLSAVTVDRRGLPTLTAGLELAVAFQNRVVTSELYGRLAPFDGSMIASALGAVGPVSYFLARAEGLLRRHDEEVAHARAAVELAARGDFGPWLARSRLALAEALIRRDGAGDREDAGRSATLSVVGSRQLGMRALLARGIALVDRLVPRPRLSTREREIAGLVAGGSSNGEIARSLGLSTRTVETHVQNVLTKLGFHARAQIAAWAVGEGLLEDAVLADATAEERKST